MHGRAGGFFGDSLIAVGYFLLIGMWSIVIPLHGAPDELTHLFLVEYLVHFGSVPIPRVEPLLPYVGELTGIEFSNATVWYPGLPFAHALGAAAFAKLFAPIFLGHEYLAARLYNWTLGGIFVFTLIRALSWSGLQSSAVRLIAVLIATIPQVTFIFAYFNHDAFGLAAVTLSLHGFLRAVKDPEQRWNAIYFGACCGLVLLAKPYHFPAIVFYALMLLALWWSDASFPLRALLLRAVPACVLVAGPMLVWTEYTFGDVFGGSGIRYFLSVTPQADSVSLGMCYVFCKGEVFNWPELSGWAWLTYSSFFGVFGWMNVFLPAAVYRFWFAPLTLVFLLLAVLFIARRFNGGRSERVAAPGSMCPS